MSVPTVSWDETAPAGTDNVSAGDNRIRELKGQVREVVDVDHKFDSSGQDADMGKHDKVSLLEQADLGTGAEGKPILGAQTVGGKAELVFTNEDDTDIQITSGEKLLIGDLDSDAYLKSTDNAGTGTVDIIKANANDDIELSDGLVLPESTAPTTAADQGAVYVKNSGTQAELYFREESNGDEVQITDGGAVKASIVATEAGTVAHGGTISPISGYTYAQCSIMVSINSLTQPGENAPGGDEYTNLCSVNQSTGAVVCQTSAYGYTGTANYIIIGVK